MIVMCSRDFSQRVSEAMEAARVAPVIITDQGKPAYVLMSYAEYENTQSVMRQRSGLQALMPNDAADVELDLQSRSRVQRRSVDLEDD